MFGIILLICLYLVLGFMYAWVMNMVSKDDVPVVKGAVILFLVAIISLLIGAALKDQSDVVQILGSVGGQFAALVGLTIVIAGLEVKHAVISAAIYTVLLFLAGLGLAMCAG